jgi:tyrosinase
MADPLVRRDAWKLSAISTWEPTLLWYAKAVGELSSRPASDPTSWRFQGAVHGYSPDTDPFVNLGSLPSQDVQDRFWNQCQHGTWFFLPWHRMYLGLYEEIVRAAVVKLGGPTDWTLPYWNYSDGSNPNARSLPPCFLEPTLPDGSPNPLFVIQGVNILRAPAVAAGDPSAIADSDVDLSGCLAESFYSPDTDRTSGDLGFGGPATGFNHNARVFGSESVENIPHNIMHVNVGGEWVQGGVTLDGWMINPDTAALDPIFWLHHANIDRLWAVWSRISAANMNPSASVNVQGQNVSWATSVSFSFFGANGSVVTMTPSQMIDTATSPFAYEYEDTSNPFAPSVTESLLAARSTKMKPGPPEMVGASDKAVTLTGSAQTTAFVLQPPSGPARLAAEPQAARTYLSIENVTSEKSHATYDVYVNLPDHPDAAAYKEHHAGALPMFGVVQASTPSERHPGDGLNFSLDITKLVNRLKARNAWDEKNIRVTFAPRGAGDKTQTALPVRHQPIRVGRVSLYKS